MTSLTPGLPFWASFGTDWLDMRPAWTCLIGIILAITLNKVTSYYTHTQYSPVKSLAKSLPDRACDQHHSRVSPSATSRPSCRPS